MDNKTKYMIGGGVVAAGIAAYFIFRPKTASAAAATPAKQLGAAPKPVTEATIVPAKPAAPPKRTNVSSAASSSLARLGLLNRRSMMVMNQPKETAAPAPDAGGGLLSDAQKAAQGVIGYVDSAGNLVDSAGNLLGGLGGGSSASDMVSQLGGLGGSSDGGNTDLENQFLNAADQGQADMSAEGNVDYGSSDTEYAS
jgi:hypothetical protein